MAIVPRKAFLIFTFRTFFWFLSCASMSEAVPVAATIPTLVQIAARCGPSLQVVRYVAVFKRIKSRPAGNEIVSSETG
jgi:hypothetical protein